MIDSIGSRLSFFGRVADDFRREPASPGEYRMALRSPAIEALYKQDGHFVFSDLPPSAAPYALRLLDGLYQGRELSKALPSAAPVEVAYDGEDEVYVFVKTVNGGTRQITFDAIPFLPVVRRGASVIGESGATTTLFEDLAGVDVTTATLASVAGVSAGDLLRIVRSRCLRAKAGPYYPFPAGTTIVYVRVVEDSVEEPPLGGATAHLAQVNGAAPASTAVGGVVLRHVTIAGPTVKPVLGTSADLDAFTDGRGNAVFYFPGHWALSALQIAISQPGYTPATTPVALTAGRPVSVKVKLAPL